MSAARDPAALSAAKRAVLEQRLRGTDEATAVPMFPHRPRSIARTLSAGQRRLWFLHQMAPLGSAYTMFDARRMRGAVDAAVLRSCIAEVVRTHEVLRTRYVQRDGRPEPVVSVEPAFDFETVAVSGGAPDARERQARAFATAFIGRSFDLEAGPVMRAALVRVAELDHIFILAVHHIACDAWSLEILWRDIGGRYAASVAGRAHPPAAQTLQYADFAHWQEAQRGVPARAAEHLAYWRNVLADCPPPLELPPDRVPPLRRSFAGGAVSGRVDGELTVRLDSLARSAGTTRFVLHVAAFLVLLYRHTGERDLVVGVPASGRVHPALESVVGFFLNTLALRVGVAGDLPFLELLQRVHAAFLDGMTHGEVPFEDVVDAIAPDRRLNQNPLFSVMFVEQGEQARVSFGEGLRVSRYAVSGGGAKFDLTLFAGPRDGGLDLMIEYDAERFEAATAERMLEQYRTVLDAIAAEPSAEIASLRVASPAERRIVQAWSRGPALAGSTPVHERFAAHARTAPGRVAAVDEHGPVTYDALLRRADGIARALLRHGLERGERVGLCGERSVELIAGMLGILRAGGAYVPLDPDYPPARLDFAMHDAGVRIVLAHAAHAARVVSAGRVVLPLGEARADTAHDAHDLPQPSFDDPAYVIHTSGSTGEPKGVLVTHGNLAYSTAARDVVYPEPPGVFLLLPPFAFDSSVAGIFWSLASGGTLALPPKRIEQDVDALAVFISTHGVTHTLCLPSLWEVVLAHAPVRPLASLRTVIVAGEACSTRLVRRHYDTLPEVALWNEYGPTEATVWCSAYRVPAAFDGARVPIGRPIAGARLHVLTADGEPAPIGVPGELWVGGAGVASYLNRPEDARLRFLPDAFSGEPGARVYRTGDLARWRDDGVLEFLGRVDQQVKVRGHRIEPAEIEAVLRQHVDVRDVVVGARALDMHGGPGNDAARIAAALSALPPGEAEELLALAEGSTALEASA